MIKSGKEFLLVVRINIRKTKRGRAMKCAEELYRDFINGDNDAFDKLIEMYRSNLIFFINRYVHDIHAAEDLAIDSFMYIYVNKKKFNFKVTLKTYLFTIGRSRAIDYLRKTKVLNNTDLMEHQKELSEVEDEVIKDEQARTVNEAVKALPADMSAAVSLVYFEGLSYDETAKVMKKNKKQIDNLLYRAKKVLKNTLTEDIL